MFDLKKEKGWRSPDQADFARAGEELRQWAAKGCTDTHKPAKRRAALNAANLDADGDGVLTAADRKISDPFIGASSQRPKIYGGGHITSQYKYCRAPSVAPQLTIHIPDPSSTAMR